MQSPTDTEKLRYLFHLDQVLGKMNMVNPIVKSLLFKKNEEESKENFEVFPESHQKTQFHRTFDLTAKVLGGMKVLSHSSSVLTVWKVLIKSMKE